jgi:hypothetical protein
MDIRNDLYTYRPMKRDEALKRRVSKNDDLHFSNRINPRINMIEIAIFSA